MSLFLVCNCQNIKSFCFWEKFGDLMSSSCPCPRIGRLLYRTKCDPYVMLPHALGATKTTSTGGTGSKPLPIQHVASYLNEKVHDLSSNIAKYDEAPGDSCGFDLEEFVSCISPDLREMMNELTLSK